MICCQLQSILPNRSLYNGTDSTHGLELDTRKRDWSETLFPSTDPYTRPGTWDETTRKASVNDIESGFALLLAITH